MKNQCRRWPSMVFDRQGIHSQYQMGKWSARGCSGLTDNQPEVEGWFVMSILRVHCPNQVESTSDDSFSVTGVVVTVTRYVWKVSSYFRWTSSRLPRVTSPYSFILLYFLSNTIISVSLSLFKTVCKILRGDRHQLLRHVHLNTLYYPRSEIDF